jgi:hypothetical protein
MAGFANDASGQDIVYANNFDFSGNTNVAAQFTTNGQLLIGNALTPHIRPGTLTSPGGTVTIGYSAPNITLDVAAGAGVIETITGDSGGAESPLAGNFNFTGGTTGLTFAGTAHTETLSGILVLANGGTSASLTANNGGIFYSNATTGAILAGTATATQMLQSGASSAPAWSTTTWPATSTINQILYSSAANVISGLATANNGVLTTGTSGTPVITALASNGQLIIGSGSGAPIAATLTPGAGIAITNAANSITIAATESAFAYTNVNFAASPYTVLISDYYISVDTSGGAVVLKFPNVPTAKQTWVVKDRTGNASTNNISITTVGGSVTIDGQTTYKIIGNYGAVDILANATPTYEIF